MIHSGAHRHEDQNPADLAWSTVLFPPTRPCSLCYTQALDKATARGLRWTPSGSRIGSETVSHDGTATRLLQRKPHARSSANASRLAAGRHGSVWPYAEFRPRECERKFGRTKERRERRCKENTQHAHGA